MKISQFMKRSKRWVAGLLLVTFTSASLGQEATIRVTRKATDQYAVSKSEVVITIPNVETPQPAGYPVVLELTLTNPGKD